MKITAVLKKEEISFEKFARKVFEEMSEPNVVILQLLPRVHKLKYLDLRKILRGNMKAYP